MIVLVTCKNEEDRSKLKALDGKHMLGHCVLKIPFSVEVNT